MKYYSLLLMCLFVVVWPADGLANGVSGSVGKTTKAGDEIITISFEFNGKQYQLVAQTGATGSNNRADDIPKGTSGPAKAKLIEDAVNAASDAFDADLDGDGNPDVPDPIAATSVSDVIAFGDNVNGVKIKSVKMTSSTGEKTRFNKPTDGAFAMSDVTIGAFTLIGAIAGIDDDGAASSVSFGTDRYTAVVDASQFSRKSDLLSALVDDLRGNGIDATLVGEMIIVLLDPVVDDGLIFATTDKNLDVDGSVTRF